MKHKLLTVLLALVAAFCLCFGLAACGEKTSPQDPSISAPNGSESTENNQDADGEGEEKEPEGDEETNPDEGGGNPDEGGGTPDEGGGNPDEGGSNPDEGGSNPDEGGGNPEEGGGNPEEGGGNPDEGGGNPEEGGGTPEEGGGNPDEGGGNPDQGGEGQTCAHEYTAENKCKFCGDEWEHTPFEVFEFMPVTLNGIEGYDACFGQSPAASDEAGSAAFEGDEIVFPYGYNGLPVISIGRFQSCTSDTVKAITVPKSILSWGDASFMGAGHGSFACKALETLNLPDGLPLPMLEIDYGYGTSTEPPIYRLSAAALFGPSRSAYVCPLWNDPQFRENGALYIGSYLVDAYFEEPVETFTVRNGTKVILECYGAENVILPDSVETIGSAAFFAALNEYRPDNQTQLKSIDLGDGVKVIGDNAFAMCVELKSITIPESVAKIGYAAFCNCTGLTEIILREGVTEIGDFAFSGCTGLTEIILREGVTEIGKMAFGECAGLKHVEIPGSVKTMGVQVFYNCTELESVTIGRGATEIWYGVFAGGCSGLTHVEIPDSVTLIGDGAFLGCSGLKSIKLPDSVTLIGDFAFSGCTGLKSIKLPDSVKKIGVQAFSGCTGLTNIEIPDSVTEIGAVAFWNCTGLQEVTIGSGVTSIATGEHSVYEGGSFAGCSGLEHITVSDKNTVYQSEGDCLIERQTNKLIVGSKNSVIPADVDIIGEYAFDGIGLTSIVIPEGVTEIGEGAFYDCNGLEGITVAADNQNYSSQDGILYNKEKTEIILVPKAIKGAVTIAYGVTSLGRFAFSGCKGPTSITIPKSVTSIGENAFYGFKGLTSITIPDSVTSIENGAFDGCSGLTSIEIPYSVTKIGVNVFSECSGLESITVAAENQNYCSQGGILYNKEKTNIVFVPEAIKGAVTIAYGVTSIMWEFTGRSEMTSVTIPDTVAWIGRAFSGCWELQSVTIGSGVTEIDYGAFAYCEKLTDIQFKGTVEAWQAIEKGYDWDYNTGNYTVTCTNGTVDKEGNVTYFE